MARNKRRIAVAGFMHESNTFNPMKTDRAAFQSQGLAFGADLLPLWRDAHHEVGGFLHALLEEGQEILPLVMAWATPSGPVEDAVFDEITTFLGEALRRHRPDGLLLALHGAMVTESHLDADGETLARIRQAVGPELPVVVTLDLHGNISQRLVDHCNLALAYRTYPHIDQFECGVMAARRLLLMLDGLLTPYQALAKPLFLMNIMRQGTDAPPMATFQERARRLEKTEGIDVISLLPGFPYADVPQMGPSVLVVSKQSREQAQGLADQLARELWEAREQFTTQLPEAREAIEQALRSQETPVVLVDTGDNVGGGSAGDGTVILAEMLRQGATDGVVCLYAPQAVQQCVQAGVGNIVRLTVGGQVDRLHGEPVEVSGRVRLLHDGEYVEHAARHGGKRHNNMGLTALVEITGRNLLVLNSLRHPPFSLGQLICLGIEPARQRLLVVKAAIAYKAAYAPVARTIIEVDTPGLTAVNPRRFSYRHIRRSLFPLE